LEGIGTNIRLVSVARGAMEKALVAHAIEKRKGLYLIKCSFAFSAARGETLETTLVLYFLSIA